MAEDNKIIFSMYRVGKSFPPHRQVLKDISLSFFLGAKIGIIGLNGSGKSTLMKIIAGVEKEYQGEVTFLPGYTVGHLPQDPLLDENRTVREIVEEGVSAIMNILKEYESINNSFGEPAVYENPDKMQELMDRQAVLQEKIDYQDGWNMEHRIERAMDALRCPDSEARVNVLSGGERRRVALCRLLLQQPDILLLDEPTNHLDIESIMWLESFLETYSGAVILVSHDRTFLDNVTRRTIEISLGKVYDYKVPYTKYTELRRERREQQEAAYRNQQKMIEDTERFIERFRYKPTKSVQVQSKIKQLKKLERIEIEEEDTSSINIRFSPAPRSGTVVVEAEEASKRYGSHLVLDRISLKIERGEKVAFVGRNGEGKTTLARMILGQVDHEGLIKRGHNVRTGYFAQNQDELLDDDATVLETVDRIARGDIRTRLRDILGAFLFHGDDIDKKVKVLSGGERSRLAIVQLLLEPYNLLLLDEPTNHLDIRSKEILKKALIKFDGTLIVVSHDRDFLDGLVTKVYEFRDRKIKTHLGGITEFLRARKIESLRELEKRGTGTGTGTGIETGTAAGTGSGKKKVATPVEDPTVKEPEPTNKMRYLEKKETERVYRRLRRETEQTEADITGLEEEIAAMDARLASGDSSVVNDASFYEAYEDKKKRLEAFMQQWEKAHSELESFISEYMNQDDSI